VVADTQLAARAPARLHLGADEPPAGHQHARDTGAHWVTNETGAPLQAWLGRPAPAGTAPPEPGAAPSTSSLGGGSARSDNSHARSAV